MTKIMKAVSALLLLAAPAGGGGEFEQKFHEAYAMEVVEGDVKGAALVYMALMRNEDAPEAVRYESKFRFAVCTVLIGRADEGRTHLTELIQDPKTPEGVRKKAEDYRAAVAGIGVGTELEKKLQSLVFDLGRVSPAENVPAYRDFEIIGPPALPFLRKMLTHSDANLRIHAYRLLCRMNEPGMAERWSTDIGLNGHWTCADISGYLKRHPAELAAFEKRILSLGDAAVEDLYRMIPTPGFSIGFIGALGEKRTWHRAALKLVRGAGTLAEHTALIRGWILGEDEQVSIETVLWLMAQVQKGVPEGLDSAEVFNVVVERLIHHGKGYLPLGAQNAELGLGQLSAKRTGAELLAALTRVIEAGEASEGNPYVNPAHGKMARKLADTLDAKIDEEVDLVAYTALLDRWVVLQRKLNKAFAKMGSKRGVAPDQTMIRHFTAAVWAMPEEAAVAEIRRILDLYGPQTGIPNWNGLVYPVDSDMRVRILVETMRFVDANQRPQLVAMLPFARGRSLSPALAKAQLEALLEVIPLLPPAGVQGIATNFIIFMSKLEPKVAQEHVTEILRLLPKLDAKQRLYVVRMTSGYYNRMPEYLGGVAPVAAANAWDILEPMERNAFIGQMVMALSSHATGAHDLGENRVKIGEFVRTHYGDLDRNLFGLISTYPDLFPPEEWIPLAPQNTRMNAKRDQAESDRIAKALAKDVSKMNETAIEFVRKYASPAVQTEVFERGVALTELAARQRFTMWLRTTTGAPVGIGTVEKTLAAILGEEPTDLREVSRLATIVLTQRPSEKLFPVASLLLGSEERAHILTGVHIAQSLGREDMVADLSKLLDSMDSQIRTAAKKAIDSINEVARIKRDKLRKEAGLIPK